MYTQERTSTEDITLYVKDSKKLISISLAGAGVPSSLIELDKEMDAFNAIVHLLPEVFEIEINPNLDFILGLDDRALDFYISAFEDLARRGIYVYDKSDISSDDDLFHLVMKPITDIRIDSVVPEIPKELPTHFNSFNLLEFIK